MVDVDLHDEELLLGYVEGELTPAQRKTVEQLLRSDPRLSLLLHALVADRQGLRELPDPPAPDWLMDEVDRQLERAMLVEDHPAQSFERAVRHRHLLRRVMMVGAVAASVAVVATVVISSLTGPLTPSIGPMLARTTPPVGPGGPVGPGVTSPHTDSAAHHAGEAEGPWNHPLPDGSVAAKPKGPAPVAGTPSGALADGDPVVGSGDGADSSAIAGVTPGGEAAAGSEAAAPDDKVAKAPGARLPGGVPEIFAGTVPERADMLYPPMDWPVLDERRQVARMLVLLPSQPELGQQLELRIVTRDVKSTRRLLTQLSGRKLLGGGDDVTGSTAGPSRDEPQVCGWRVPVLDVPKLVQKLQAAPWQTRVQWQRRRGSVREQGRAPWPSLTPDYSAVVQQQVPPIARPTVAANDRVDLMVLIEPAPKSRH